MNCGSPPQNVCVCVLKCDMKLDVKQDCGGQYVLIFPPVLLLTGCDPIHPVLALMLLGFALHQIE